MTHHIFAMTENSSSGCTLPLACIILANREAYTENVFMDGVYGGSTSDELSSVFDAVAAASSVDFDGHTIDRYTRRVFGNLVWSIETRSYGPEVMRLCHLLRAAGACGARGGYLDILYPLDPIRPGVLRRLMQPHRAALQRAGIEDYGDNVVLSYPDGAFELSHASMPDMIILFEFLVMILGFEHFDEIGERLSGPGISKTDVAVASNRLQKTIYAWLSDHLPPVQIHRKNRILSRFMSDARDGDFNTDDLDDAAILDFWLRFSSDSEMDFRMYRSVYAGFRQLRMDMSDNAEATRFRRAISSYSFGDDPESVDIMGQLYAAPSDDAFPDESRATNAGFEALVGVTIDDSQLSRPVENLDSDDFARVKFLSARDRDLIRDLVDDPFAVEQLPLSTLRMESFGRGQNILKEGRGAGGNRIADALLRATERSYRDALADFRKVRERLGVAMDASFYILSQSGVGMPADVDGVVRPDFDIMPRARKAFERVERAGFRRSEIGDEEILNIHRLAAGDLHRIADALDRIIRIWERHLDSSGDEIYVQDKDIFIKQFKLLYGEQS